MGRFSGSYPSHRSIENDPNIAMRHVISLAAIELAADSFQKVVEVAGMERPLASFAKSLSEYKVGNYETSIVLAWLITESSISTLWKSHIDSLNSDLAGGRRRISSSRRGFLTGRDFPIGIVSNILEMLGILDHGFFADIDAVRGYRNKIVHAKTFRPGTAEAQLAMKTAHYFIERLWKIRFTPSYGYTVHWV